MLLWTFDEDICSVYARSQRENVMCLLFYLKLYVKQNDSSRLRMLNAFLKCLIIGSSKRENMRLGDLLFYPSMIISVFPLMNEILCARKNKDICR